MPPVAQPPLFISVMGEIGPSLRVSLLTTISEAVKSGCKDVHLLMHSGGGMVDDAMVLHHTLKAFPIKLSAHNLHSVDSMAIIVFLAAEKRSTVSSATFFAHGISMPARMDMLNQGAVGSMAQNIAQLDERIVDIMVERTAQKPSEVKGWMTTGTQFTAATALAANIVQDVTEVNIPIRHQLVFVGN